MKFNKVSWVILSLLAVSIGLYAFSFLFTDSAEGFIEFKRSVFEPGKFWRVAFYVHILLGGVALLTGWSQFSKKIRSWNISFHRTLGKIYVVAIFFSSIAGLYMGVLANGGIIAKLGFSGMAIAWLITTLIAYTSIRQGDIDRHRRWMIRSYAVTLAGVSFRLWLPLLLFGFGLDFIPVYRIDSWISWVLNLVIAEVLIMKSFQVVKSKSLT